MPSTTVFNELSVKITVLRSKKKKKNVTGVCNATCFKYVYRFDGFIIFVYLSSLPDAHLSDAPRRRLVVTGDSVRIQGETTEISAWFFNVLGV